jgi:hypothetical protein
MAYRFPECASCHFHTNLNEDGEDACDSCDNADLYQETDDEEARAHFAALWERILNPLKLAA